MSVSVRITIALLASLAVPIAPLSAAELTAEQWREDLAVLAERLPDVHKEPFHTVSSTDFEAAVTALYEAIPDLEQHEIIVRIALRTAGHDEEALANYRKSLELRPDSPTGLRAVQEIEHARR